MQMDGDRLRSPQQEKLNTVIRYQKPNGTRIGTAERAPTRQPESIESGMLSQVVEVSPPDVVRRSLVTWCGMAAESIQLTRCETIELRFRAPLHLLVAYEQGERTAGETFVEGLPRSTLRSLSRRFTFVPAGHEYRELWKPRALTRITYFYFDPAKLQSRSDLIVGDVALAPRLLFEDASLWSTTLKLTATTAGTTVHSRLFLQALSVILVHELVHINCEKPRTEAHVRGGLAGWQKRTVVDYIEEHLSERITLSTLAQLVRLSPAHFCRAFKQSFGLPPHRYHTSRRIEHAKDLLLRRQVSVTEIGLEIGFSETSSFSSAFRKATGMTPSRYHRSAG